MDEILKHVREDIRDKIANYTPEDLAKLVEIGFLVSSKKEITQTSSSKGQEGEKIIEKIISKNFKIKNTSKTAKSGDFHIHTSIGLILVEVKNYSRTVGKAELDKFYRDIARDNKIKAGIFISLNADIIGIDKLQYEDELIDGKHIPIMYIPQFKKDSYRLLTMIVEMIIAHVSSKQRSKDGDVEYIIGKIEQLSRDMTILSQSRNLLNEMRTNMNKSLDELYNNISTAELHLTRTMDEIQDNMDWKRVVPYHTLKDIWMFIKSKLNVDDRYTNGKMLKNIIVKYHKQPIYYTSEYFMIKSIRLYQGRIIIPKRFIGTEEDIVKIVKTGILIRKKTLSIPLNNKNQQYVENIVDTIMTE